MAGLGIMKKRHLPWKKLEACKNGAFAGAGYWPASIT